MAVTRERLRAILGAQASLEQWFLIRALETLLGDAATNSILDELIPAAPAAQALYFGRPLGFYSGLSRARMKQADIGLTDEQVDAVFEALGIVSGTGATNPAAAQLAAEKGMFQESQLQTMRAEPSEDNMNDGVAVAEVVDTDVATTPDGDLATEVEADAQQSEEGVEDTSGSDESAADSRVPRTTSSRKNRNR